MMKSEILVLVVLITISSISAKYMSYNNYKVYKVVAETEKQVKVLTELQSRNEYDFWTDVVHERRNVWILVSPEKFSHFEEVLSSNSIKANVVIEDVQGAIENQMKRPLQINRSSQEYNWEYYQDFNEINDWLNKTVAAHSNVASLVNIGTSIGGRYITGIIIDYKKRPNPVIGMIEGTLHAREWITPVTCTWIIKELLTSTDEDIRVMAENIVWHIFPVTNPDGYVYSFTDNRMWRKNRNTANFVSCAQWNVDDDLSNGVDLNRNFGFMWMTVGASSNPCTQTFAGPVAFSERESAAIANYVRGLQTQGHLLYYFAMHSFSNMILVPYSHVGGADVLEVPNYADMFEIARRGADKLTARHGTEYLVGTSKDILYEVGGAGFDWVKGSAHVPLVFLFELRDTGEYGFLLPPEQIIPTCEEVMDGLIEMDKTARALGYYRSSASVFRIGGLLFIATLFAIII